MEARNRAASAHIAVAAEADGAGDVCDVLGAADVCDVAGTVGVAGVGDDEAAQAVRVKVRRSAGAMRRTFLDIGIPSSAWFD
jgi:hypothetical protein